MNLIKRNIMRRLYQMTKLESATFLIKNGYVKTRYYEGKFQVKMTPKGQEAYLLLNRLKELSK
jgi:hypothetical protein